MEIGLYSLPLAGGIAGILLGFIARSTFFCSLSSLESYWYGENADGVRTWVLAIATAIGLTQILVFAGWFNPADSFYIEPQFNLLATIIGGLSFGFGMALVGTCGFGALVRLGGGSLKSLMAIVVLGLVALSTQRGILSYVRTTIESAPPVDFSAFGSASLTAILGTYAGPSSSFVISLLIALALATWVLGDREYRRQYSQLGAGIAIGSIITFGWMVTTYFASHSFEPVQVESASFVAPVSDTILQFELVTGTLPDYGVGLVPGVVVGAAIAAMRNQNVRWEACDDARELSRHITGAAMMGFGGMLALGCTVGQGISAASVLAISAPVAIASIIVGAKLGLAYLLEGSPLSAFRH